MESTNPGRTNDELLEERADLRGKLTALRADCDRLKDRVRETKEELRGLEISLRGSEKKRDEMEARVEEISRSFEPPVGS